MRHPTDKKTILQRILFAVLAVCFSGLLMMAGIFSFYYGKAVSSKQKQVQSEGLEATADFVDSLAQTVIRNKIRSETVRVAALAGQHVKLQGGGDKSLSELRWMLNREKVGSSGFLFAVDSAGVIRSHPDYSFIGKTTSEAGVSVTGKDKEGFIRMETPGADGTGKRVKVMYSKVIPELQWILFSTAFLEEIYHDIEIDVKAMNPVDGGQVSLITSEGKFLFHEEYGGMRVEEVSGSLKSIYSEALTGQNGDAMYVAPDGKEYYASFRMLPNSRLVICVVNTLSPAVSYMLPLAGVCLAILAVCLLIGATVAKQTARVISSPLNEIAGVLDKESGETFDLPMDANHDCQELVGFCKSFNSFLNNAKIVRTRILYELEMTRKKAVASQSLAEALEMCRDMVLITDKDGNITYVNNEFEGFTGYTSAEMIGKPASVLKSNRHDTEYYSELWKKIKSGGAWRGNLINVKKDGEFYEADMTISPVRENTGKIKSYVCISKDVTAQVQMEKQLQQQTKMRAVSTMANGIAHDFNNIIAAILGYSEMALLEAKGQPLLEEKLNKILKSGLSAKEVIGQLMTFCSSGAEEAHPVDISIVSKGIVKELRSSVPVGIEVFYRAPSEVCEVAADSSQIHQVIMNLCNNAVEAMANQPGMLAVIVEQKMIYDSELCKKLEIRTGDYVRISVSDKGKGMDEDILKRIFEPFYTTRKHGDGAGMGLSIVHGIVKSCNGAVEVKSEEGKGSCFVVYLPKLKQTDAGVEYEDAVHTTDNEKILVVDDEQFIRDISKKMLEDLGYAVETAEGSLEALNTLKQHSDKYDLMITDQIMPEMTGMALAVEAKKLRPHMKVLLCTGFSQGISSEQSKAAGITQVLPKPYSKQELGAVVRKALLAGRSKATAGVEFPMSAAADDMRYLRRH